MALKKKITKKEFEKLPEILQAEYGENDDGDYVLSVEGEEDLGALKRAKEHEATKRKEETKRRKELETELAQYKAKEEESADDDAKKKGDVEALETSYKAKIKKLEETKNGDIEKLRTNLSSILVDSVADKLANEISSAPKLLAPFIKQRLKADFEGDSPTTRILDSNGQISALTLDELKEEFKKDSDFASVIIASQASGGVKPTNTTNPGSSFGGGSEPPNLLTMTDEQLTAYVSENKPSKE